jgi:hypothetical protein
VVLSKIVWKQKMLFLFITRIFALNLLFLIFQCLNHLFCLILLIIDVNIINFKFNYKFDLLLLFSWFVFEYDFKNKSYKAVYSLGALDVLSELTALVVLFVWYSSTY